MLQANRPALEEIAMRLERDGSLDGVAAEAILRADEGSEVRAEPRIGNSNEPEAPSAAPGGE